MQNQLIILGGIVIVIAMLSAGFFWWRGKVDNEDPLGLAGKLADEKAKSEIILRAIDDGMVLIDHKNVIRHFNQAAADTLGWKLDEAMGLDWRSVFRFVDEKGQNIAEEDIPFVKAYSNGLACRDSSMSVVTKANKNVAVSFTVSPLLDEDEQVKGLVGIFRDITAEKQQESQRAEFISTASHEMRTPVAAIEGYLSLALNDKVATIDARARQYLEKAHSSTQHLGQLFQDLLTSAKAEDGRLTSHPQVIEVGEFLEQLANDLRFAAQKKNLFMQFVFGSSGTASSTNTAGGDRVVRPLYYVMADPDRLREVITNLFDNACKYTEQGSVTLGLTGDTEVVQLYIKDTGAGIPTEDIPHLFQKFYRVDNSSTRTVGGTGLGLFISRKIIELYEGRIWVESTIGVGSTFYINLPRISTQKAEQLGNASSGVLRTPAT
jgi:two-component system, OmpR family, sensor histidine kinase VicK